MFFFIFACTRSSTHNFIAFGTYNFLHKYICCFSFKVFQIFFFSFLYHIKSCLIYNCWYNIFKYLYFVVIMTMCLSAIDISHYVYERFWQQNYLIITYLLVNLCAQNKKKIIKETLVFLFFCYWLLENFYILKNYMIFTL